MSQPRTAAVQNRTNAENDALEVLVREDEQHAFDTRLVEDVARIHFAISRGLDAEAEQMAARLLVVSQRRFRQKYGAEVAVRKWGV